MNHQSQQADLIVQFAKLQVSMKRLLYGLFFAIHGLFTLVSIALLAAWIESSLNTGLVVALVASLGSVLLAMICAKLRNTSHSFRRECWLHGPLVFVNLLVWSISMGSVWLLLAVAINVALSITFFSWIRPDQSLSTLPESSVEFASPDLDPQGPETVSLTQFEPGVPEEDTQAEHALTRTSLPNGEESICGISRATFDQGQKISIIHIPFWPLVDNISDVFVEAGEGIEVNAKVTQQSPAGIRIEVKRMDQSLDPAWAAIEWNVLNNAQASESLSDWVDESKAS